MQRHTAVEEVQTGDPSFDAFANAVEIEDDTDPSVDDAVDEGEPEAIDEAASSSEQPPSAEAEPVPPAASAPTPETPTPATPDPEMRRRLTLLEQQNREYQETAQRQQLDQWEQEAVATYQNQGFTAEQARLAAQQNRRQYEAQAQLRRQHEIALENERGRYNAALHYGKQFGVDPASLISFSSPQEMEREARHMKEVNDLRSEVTKLKQAKVPAGQTFDNGRSTAAPSDSDEAWMQRYIDGDHSPKAVAAGRKAAGF